MTSVTDLPRPLYGCRIHPGQRQWSRLSLEEIIEIWRRRLVDGRYTRQEAKLVRTALTGHMIGRVSYLRAERKYWESVKELGQAFQLSPKAVLQWYVGNLLASRSVKTAVK